jgi:hypothetical protein
MQHKNHDYIPSVQLEYKKNSNVFIGATFAVALVIVMIGMIFG